MNQKPLGLIEQLLENQKEIMRSLRDVALDKRLTQAWYTTSECAALKGISHTYLIDNRWARPLGGVGQKMVAGRKRSPRAAVKEWLDQADAELLKLYGTEKDRQRAAATSQRIHAFASSRKAAV